MLKSAFSAGLRPSSTSWFNFSLQKKILLLPFCDFIETGFYWLKLKRVGLSFLQKSALKFEFIPVAAVIIFYFVLEHTFLIFFL